jgi:hypothetical protein
MERSGSTQFWALVVAAEGDQFRAHLTIGEQRRCKGAYRRR